MGTPKLICFALSAILAVTAAFAEKLNPGQSLALGGSITSPDGRFTLVLQADGNLVLYPSGGVARWATGTVGRTVSQAAMQADGNFVLYGPEGPIWATATDGHPGAYLAVQDDGNVVIYGPSGPLWAYSRLNPGQSLEVWGSVPSLDGRFTLVLQADGNLVLYQSGAARWATDTVGRTVSKAAMQADGNFVLYGPEGPIWATATDGHPGAYLAVQDDGNVVIYGPSGPLWASRKNYVRRSINSLAPNGPEIAALRTGFQVMQGRQPSDPTSSIYQANMHGTVDRPLLADWETCQHGSFFFLSWHRMYLYYFERILRAASGDPYLSLPYWNYSDAADPNARALPLPFRQPQNATNSLYVPQRDPAINAGGQMPPSAVSLSALTILSFSTPANGFGGGIIALPAHGGSARGALEITPHGVVHILVGGSGSGCPNGGGWMSCFEFAARDPIFWLHHANIDRLWEQWLAQGGGRSNPTDQGWLTTQFEFFDENGHSVKLSGQQIVDTAGQLNYVYNENPWTKIAQVSPKPTATAAHPTGGAVPIRHAPSVRQLGTSEVPAVELKREPATVPIKLAREEEFKLKATERAIVLDIEGIEFDQMPNGYYEIYLNLPQGEPPDFRGKYYVGNLQFFGVKPREQHHEGEKPPRFRYDITKIIDGLKSDEKWNKQEAKVTFVEKEVIAPRGMRTETKVAPVRIQHVTITTE